MIGEGFITYQRDVLVGLDGGIVPPFLSARTYCLINHSNLLVGVQGF